MKGYPIKLVRDRVSEIDTSVGLAFRPVRDGAEHTKLLRVKLLEEVGEYLVNPSIEELVDVLEVVMCLAHADLGILYGRLLVEAEDKRAERGSFTAGTVMETVEP